jgi:hypothetical protein
MKAAGLTKWSMLEMRRSILLRILCIYLSVDPHISWATKITPAMPTRSSKIISKARVQPQPPAVIDRRSRQLQINALDDKHTVNGKLVISVRDSSTKWFSKIGQYSWLRFCQNWLHQERKSLIVVIWVVTVRYVITENRFYAIGSSQPVFHLDMAPGPGGSSVHSKS